MHNAAIMIHKFEILSRESTDSDGIMIHNVRQLMKNAQKTDEAEISTPSRVTIQMLEGKMNAFMRS